MVKHVCQFRAIAVLLLWMPGLAAVRADGPVEQAPIRPVTSGLSETGVEVAESDRSADTAGMRAGSSARSVPDATYWIDLDETPVTALRQGAGATPRNTGVAAPIYRSNSCGHIYWIDGAPVWYEQMILTNAAIYTPLREYSAFVCTDVCHVNQSDFCEPTGPCDCLDASDLPIHVSLQLYDGDPCTVGIPIPGTQETFELSLDPADVGDGYFNCFILTMVPDPKVMLPSEVWLELAPDHEDTWVFVGDAFFGYSPQSGLDNGVDCSTWYDDPPDPNGCVWMWSEAYANADFTVSLVPVLPPPSTDWAAVSTYTVAGDTAYVEEGGQPVWFEVRIGDWDPYMAGVQLRAWQAGLDSSGYSSGLQGELTPYLVDCTADPGVCPSKLGPGSYCPYPPTTCPAGRVRRPTNRPRWTRDISGSARSTCRADQRIQQHGRVR